MTALATTVGTVIPCGYNIGILNSPQKVLPNWYKALYYCYFFYCSILTIYSWQIIENFCNASLLDHYGVQVEKTPLELLWSAVVSIFLVGGGIGAVLGGPIADRLGRWSRDIKIGNWHKLMNWFMQEKCLIAHHNFEYCSRCAFWDVRIRQFGWNAPTGQTRCWFCRR